nr:polysaccharide deacetylase family protein [Sphingobacterium lactis]
MAEVLERTKVKGSFFVTGRFLEDGKSARLLKKLYDKGHLIGPHSDRHLLYAPWEDRDSLLVTKAEFRQDLQDNLLKLSKIGIADVKEFIAPYEWYNQTIADWTSELGLTLYNFTPGLRTPADYTYPQMGKKYLSSEAIIRQLLDFEERNSLNGHIVLIHLGTDPRRTDKLFNQLERLIDLLKNKNYKFVPLNEF